MKTDDTHYYNADGSADRLPDLFLPEQKYYRSSIVRVNKLAGRKNGEHGFVPLLE